MASNASPQKRKSSGAHGSEPALKKQMADESKAIAKAVKKANLPKDVVDLLSDAAPSCLSTFADQRHSYQKNFVKMIGEALGGIEVSLKTAASDASSAFNGLDRHKLQNQIIAEARNRAAAKEAAANTEAALVAAMLKFRIADEALKAKLKVQKTSDVECDAAEAKKAKVQEAIQKLADAKAVDGGAPKSVVASLEKVLKAVSVDASLLDVLPSVLCKEPAARGDFDATTLGSLDSELAKKLAEIEAEILPLIPAKTSRASEVAAAQATFDAAKEARDTVKTALKDATHTIGTAEKQLEAAEDNEKDFVRVLKDAGTKKDDTEKELTQFREGPLASFAKLKAQATPPPPPVEETPAPAAA